MPEYRRTPEEIARDWRRRKHKKWLGNAAKAALILAGVALLLIELAAKLRLEWLILFGLKQHQKTQAGRERLSMAIINYVTEHLKFIKHASDHGLSANERVLWYALMDIFNRAAEGNEWPEGFMFIPNGRLLSLLPYGERALLRTREEMLESKIPLFDFIPGQRNHEQPRYRMRYFAEFSQKGDVEKPAIFDGKTDGNVEKSENLDVKNGGNVENSFVSGGSLDGNLDGRNGDISINTINKGNGSTHNFIAAPRDAIYSMPRTREEERLYTSPKGACLPARYDNAWMHSDRARASVAQRILDGYNGEDKDDHTAHQCLFDLMSAGMPPELAEDVLRDSPHLARGMQLLRRLCMARRIYDSERRWCKPPGEGG